MTFDFTTAFNRNKREEFSALLEQMSETIGFKVSARGWCYLMEQAGHINKSQFNKVANAINQCRQEGILPVDFVAEEDARAFACVHSPSNGTVEDTLKWMLRDVVSGQKYFTPDWWIGEEYYIQMLVEKIDLKTLFEPICSQYHIPIANAKGWSSILQRAEYARRFKEAEERGLKCVLLYCGDHDPDGLRISDTIRNNLVQVREIQWSDGEEGYDPSDLIIERFGLNYNFIMRNGYTWIDNLITGSGKDLTDKKHKNHSLPYVQRYLREIGARKCEANAIVTTPDEARTLITEEIESWVGDEALSRFSDKREMVRQDYERVLVDTGLLEPIRKILGN